MNEQIKKEIEERDDLIKQAEALIEESDGSLTDEQKEAFDDLKAKIDKKDKYIDAKKWQEQQKAKNTVPYDRNTDDGEGKELQKFSWSKFLMYSNPNTRNSLSDEDLGFYRELEQEGNSQAKDSRIGYQGGGGIIPYNVLKQKKTQPYRGDLTVGTEGADIVFTESGGFVDALNERMVLTSLGADFITGLTNDIRWPRESNAPTGTWEGETDANAEHTPTYDNVQMSPLRVGTFIDVSNQTLLQTNPSIDARLERNLVSAIQRAIETAAINGSGTAPVPEGILNTTGIGDVAVATNGGAQAWSHWIDNETQVAQDDADMGSLAYLTNAKVRGQAKQTFIDTGSGRTIWPVNASEVNGYPVGVSNLVPDDLTKGTGTALSALIFGNFNDLVIGQWGGMEVLVDQFTQATSGLTRLVINVFADVAVLHPESFSATQDIDTTA